MTPPFLAFVNMGASEILVIAVLALFLFGAEKIPGIARQLGRAKAEFTRAAGEFERKLEEEKGLAIRPGDAVPRSHLAGTEATEEERLRRAARELGIDAEGMGAEELRRAVQERVE